MRILSIFNDISTRMMSRASLSSSLRILRMFCCSVWQSVLQSVLQCVADDEQGEPELISSDTAYVLLQCVAECVAECVALCCG